MIKIIGSIILLFLSAISGILGTLSKTEKESGKIIIKRPNSFGIAFISIIIVSLGIAIYLSHDEYTKTKNSFKLEETRRKEDSINSAVTIKELRGLRKSDSARIQNDSIWYSISIEKFNEQLGKQNKTLNKQDKTLNELVQIVKNQEEIKGVQTGGDSYGIVKFVLDRKNIYKNNFNSKFRLIFINLGDYPLYSVTLLVWERKSSFPQDDPNNQFYLGNINPSIKDNNFISDKSGGNGNVMIDGKFVTKRIINDDENIIYYKIRMKADNSIVDQTTILLLKPSHSQDFGTWVEATYLSQLSKVGIFKENIDDDFPRLKNGKIPWGYENIKMAISKNLLVWP